MEKAKLKYRKVEVTDKEGPFKRIKNKLKFMKRKKEPSRDEILIRNVKKEADRIVKLLKKVSKMVSKILKRT